MCVQAREFHAQPLPDLSPDTLPKVAKKQVTKAKPFDLESEVRGAHKAEEWSNKVRSCSYIFGAMLNRALPNTLVPF